MRMRCGLTAVDVLDFAGGSALVLEAGGTAGAGRVGGHCIYRVENEEWVSCNEENK